MTTPDYNNATTFLDEIARIDAFKAIFDVLAASHQAVKVTITFDDSAGSSVSYDAKLNGIVHTYMDAMNTSLTVFRATQQSLFNAL